MLHNSNAQQVTNKENDRSCTLFMFMSFWSNPNPMSLQASQPHPQQNTPTHSPGGYYRPSFRCCPLRQLPATIWSPLTNTARPLPYFSSPPAPNQIWGLLDRPLPLMLLRHKALDIPYRIPLAFLYTAEAAYATKSQMWRVFVWDADPVV